MKMLDAEAQKAGIELRRYTAQPIDTKEFYTEVPFEIELDGPYYSMLNFFDRVGKLERIVNVSGCWWRPPRSRSEAKAKHTYQYAPNESVVATLPGDNVFQSRSSRSGQPTARRVGEIGIAMKLITAFLH